MAKLLPEATADIVEGIDSLMEDKHHGKTKKMLK